MYIFTIGPFTLGEVYILRVLSRYIFAIGLFTLGEVYI